jgi:hypothetical protein
MIPEYEKRLNDVLAEYAVIKDPIRRDVAMAPHVYEILKEAEEVLAIRVATAKEVRKNLKKTISKMSADSEEHNKKEDEFEESFGKMQKVKRRVILAFKDYKSQEHNRRATRPGERNRPVKGRGD